MQLCVFGQAKMFRLRYFVHNGKFAFKNKSSSLSLCFHLENKLLLKQKSSDFSYSAIRFIGGEYYDDSKKNANRATKNSELKIINERNNVTTNRGRQKEVDIHENYAIARISAIRNKVVREYNFVDVCKKIENMSPDADSLDLLFFPDICIDRHAADIFISDWLQNWWALFESRLKKIEIPLLCYIYFTFSKLDKTTNRKFLKIFNWYNLQNLTEFVLTDVQSFPAALFRECLKVLEQSLWCHRNEKPNIWLNTHLLKAFETFTYANCTGGIFKFNYASKEISSILKAVVNLQLEKPSDKCLFYLTKLCVSICRRDKKRFENYDYEANQLLRIARAFYDWNINPNDFYENSYDITFWSLWYKKMEFLQSSGFIGYKKRFTAKILRYYFLIMIKFDCEKEFMETKENWSRLIKLNVSLLYPDEVQFMISEAEKKYADKRELFVNMVSSDVFYVLNKRAKDAL